MARYETKVLIVGGGPVGLTAALLLSHYAIPTILVERDPGPTGHPKARGLAIRTMEIFRFLGIEEAILHHNLPPEARRFIWTKSFSGEEIARVGIPVLDDKGLSPCSHAIVAQNVVETVLFAKVEATSEITLLCNTEASAFTQNEQGVCAQLQHRNNSTMDTIHADFMIAADGAKSAIREAAAISMHGKSDLGRYCNIYFEADLSRWVAHRPAAGFFFTDPELFPYFLLSVDGKSRWLLGTRFLPENGESAEDFTPERCEQMICKVAESADAESKILNIGFWTMGAQVAECFRKGRLFLAGDAAHLLPPTGGMGMNTGIQDAWNLAWKIAAVLKGRAEPALLDTYERERQPAAQANIAWSIENAQRMYSIFEAVA